MAQSYRCASLAWTTRRQGHCALQGIGHGMSAPEGAQICRLQRVLRGCRRIFEKFRQACRMVCAGGRIFQAEQLDFIQSRLACVCRVLGQARAQACAIPGQDSEDDSKPEQATQDKEHRPTPRKRPAGLSTDKSKGNRTGPCQTADADRLARIDD